jgi:hypothetical protein
MTKVCFALQGGQTYMDMTFTNKAMQPMSDFAIQFNKNRYGRGHPRRLVCSWPGRLQHIHACFFHFPPLALACSLRNR